MFSNLQKSPIVLLAVAFLSCLQGIAQESIVDEEVRINEQVWIDYNFNKSYTESRFVSTQVGFRKIFPEVYDRVLVISTLNNRIKNGLKLFKKEDSFFNSYQLGAGIIYTRNFNANDNLELRLLQGMKFNIPTVKEFKLYNYTRLEERIQTSFDGEGLTTAFRLRHRVSTVISWKKHLLTFTQGLYFPISAEVFFNLKKADRFNDLLRLSPGVGYKLESGWRFELFTIFNRTRNITDTNEKSSDLILRLRIYSPDKKIEVPLAPVNEFETEEEQ